MKATGARGGAKATGDPWGSESDGLYRGKRTMARKIYRLGTRKSDLAMVQSRQMAAALEKLGIHCELVPVESEGDQNRLDGQ